MLFEEGTRIRRSITRYFAIWLILSPFYVVFTASKGSILFFITLAYEIRFLVLFLFVSITVFEISEMSNNEI